MIPFQKESFHDKHVALSTKGITEDYGSLPVFISVSGWLHLRDYFYLQIFMTIFRG